MKSFNVLVLPTLREDMKRTRKPAPVKAEIVAFDVVRGPSGGYNDAEWMHVTLRAPLSAAARFPMGATVLCALSPEPETQT